jgi:hypothetical protein
VDWTVGGTPVSVRGELPVFVNYPITASDNEAAANLLHADVGKWVALGGGAYHLTEAVSMPRSEPARVRPRSPRMRFQRSRLCADMPASCPKRPARSDGIEIRGNGQLLDC